MKQLQTHYKATVIKTAWTDRHIDQWNRPEDPGIDSHNYVQLNFHKVTKAIQQRKDTLFNKWCWRNCTFIGKRKKKKNLDLNLTSYTRVNSKWIMNLNVKYDIQKRQKL